MKAESIIDVMLGEAVSGNPRARMKDLKAIASVIANRSALLGVDPQSVVASRREFNAYGKALPPGVNKFRGLAEQAWKEVQEQGPVHAGTFYATPSATKNLPKGLAPVDQTKGHVFFSDPYARSIGTALGYKKPSMDAQQQLAGLAGKTIPTPMSRPSTGFQAAPVGSVQRGLLGPIGAAPPTGGLLSVNDRAPTGVPSFDPGRFVGPSVANFDPGRFGTAPMANAGLMATTERAVKTPSAPNFDQRFGPTIEVGQNKEVLAEALNMQRGKLMAKNVPTYDDPYVTVDNTTTAATQPQETYQPVAPVSAYVAQPATPPAVAAINTASPAVQKRTIDQRIGGLLGVLAPAAIGGILAGPLGALAGGFLGKQMTDPRNQYPSKPTKGSGPKAPSMSKGEIDAMHDRASKSPQAQKAWSNGSAGLF